MKKIIILTGISAVALLLINCNPSKKVASSETPKTTYATDITTAINTYCTPCHVPDKGGNKRAYDNFANTKADIDEIIRRIELNPGERGYMPFKKPKLSDSVIAVFKKWKADGTPEN